MEDHRIPLRGKRQLAAVAAAALVALALFVLGRGLASAATEARASRGSTVTMAHLRFSPTPLHVARGTTVVFANNSRLKHTAVRPGSFNTGIIEPGKAVSIRFTAPGTYAYRCTIHPHMRGKIIVR